MAVIRDQSRKVKHVDTQQEIEQHEKELKSLLSRVLKEPLYDALHEFGSRLDALDGMVEDLQVAQSAASTNIRECIDKVSGLAKQQHNLAEKASKELAERLETTRAQLTQYVSETVVGDIADILGKRLDEMEKSLEDSRLALLEQVQGAWQSDQATRHRELREYVSTQLAIAGKSVRAVQFMTLSFAVIGAVGVVVMVVRSIL